MSIGFGWGMVHTEREVMPGGLCRGPEAQEGQMKIVTVDVRKLFKKTDVRHKTKNTLEIGSYAMDMDGVGCKIHGKTCPMVPSMVPKPEKIE
jgi:hypothetical protein